MSYNGSGVFNINTAGQPVVTGTTISSTTFNNLTADLATGLTTALTKDGQSTPTANIGMGTYKITNLGAGTVASDAARLDQVQGGTATFITVAGTDTLTGTVVPALSAYATGNQFSFLVANTNTGAVTINVDGIGAKAITRTGTTALVAGDMVAGQAVEIIYDGTRFQLVNGNSFTNLKVSGTLGVTGVATFTAQPIVSSLTASLPVFTDASKGLVSNTMTGTGNVVMSTSPTLVTPALGAATATTLAVSDSINTPNTFGFKNRIINGAMVIDQRNAGALIPSAGNQYTVDRWAFYNSQSAKLAVGQNAGAGTLPAGFINYLGAVSLSAYSVVSSDYFELVQQIEGFNTSDLSFGTANAKTVVLSFQVYSSLTGTFGGSLINSAGNRSYPFSYSVSVANTWAPVSISIAGDTTGTWLSNNDIGISVRFGLGVGATWASTAGSWQAGNFIQPTGTVSVVGTNGATFYITGVQLEKGSTATSFDFRDYGRELAMCQRYCEVVKTSGATNYANISVGACTSTGAASTVYFYQVAKRAQPTVTYSAANTFVLVTSAGGVVVCTDVSTDRSDVTNLAIASTVASGVVAGNATRLLQNDTASAQVTISAEL